MASDQSPRIDTVPKGEAPPFGWGHLKDHETECVTCEGSGCDVDSGSECEDCAGHREHRWGSFYEQDRAECEQCGADPVPVASMYEDTYVCLPCWLHNHARDCGCKLWREAEDHYGVTHG